jgi:hypothetical protein
VLHLVVVIERHNNQESSAGIRTQFGHVAMKSLSAFGTEVHD